MDTSRVATLAATVLLLILGGLASCSKPAPAPVAAPSADAGIRLALKMTSPIDVELTWHDPAGNASGHIVEYINHPSDEWVILGFFSPGRTTFHHPRLAPQTPYQYRVRPFYGPASGVVDVTIAEGLSDQAYADAYALPEDYSWAPPQKTDSAGSGVILPRSIRQPETAAAAPANLAAQVIKSTVSGFKLTWIDRSSDEEGFLLEQLLDGGEFIVCAVVPPDTNSFGWALEPPVRRGSFRVRAYRYGPPSAVVVTTTGDDPSGDAEALTATAASGNKPL